jgi:hypothetical protein
MLVVEKCLLDSASVLEVFIVECLCRLYHVSSDLRHVAELLQVLELVWGLRFEVLSIFYLS